MAISAIFAIGDGKPGSLCGKRGSQFMMDEWGYPAIGVYFADCPSAGHDMLCLDYRACGPTGEPAVVHVDQESDFGITLVAPTFESFIRGLEGDEAFVEPETAPAPPPSILWRPEAIEVRHDPGGAPKSDTDLEEIWARLTTRKVARRLPQAPKRKARRPS